MQVCFGKACFFRNLPHRCALVAVTCENFNCSCLNPALIIDTDLILAHRFCSLLVFGEIVFQKILSPGKGLRSIMKRLMDAVFFKKNPENPSPIADFSKNNLYSCRLMM